MVRLNLSRYEPTQCQIFRKTLMRRYKQLVESTIIWHKTRWLILSILTAFYYFRVWYLGHFALITYGLTIFIFMQFIDFISPYEDYSDENTLPIAEGELRPFTRKLPEFQFWYNILLGVILCSFLTCFKFIDIPADKRILIPFAIIVLILALKDRVSNMIKYRYLPWRTASKEKKSTTTTASTDNTGHSE